MFVFFTLAMMIFEGEKSHLKVQMTKATEVALNIFAENLPLCGNHVSTYYREIAGAQEGIGASDWCLETLMDTGVTRE